MRELDQYELLGVNIVARRSHLRALVLLPAAALTLTVAGCAQEINPGSDTKAGDKVSLMTQGELTTCTHLPYKPFQYTQNGKIVGFDVDLIDLVAKDLGVKQTIVDTPFEGIETGEAFKTGKCDLAAAAITITDKRDRVMDFSDGYFDANQALLVKKGSGVKALKDLKGKVLGVQQGTTGEEYAKEHQKEFGYKVKQFEDLALLQTAVKTTQIDAGINDNSVLYDFVNSNDDVEVTTEFETGEEYGFPVATGNGALQGKINDVLAQARKDGSYDKIYEKWFKKQPESGESSDEGNSGS